MRELRMWMGPREGGLVESGVRDDTAAAIVRECPNLEVLELPGSRADVKILEQPNLRSESIRTRYSTRTVLIPLHKTFKRSTSHSTRIQLLRWIFDHHANI